FTLLEVAEDLEVLLDNFFVTSDDEDTSASLTLLLISSVSIVNAVTTSIIDVRRNRTTGTLPVIFPWCFLTTLITQITNVTQKAIEINDVSIMNAQNIMPTPLAAFNVVQVCTYLNHISNL